MTIGFYTDASLTNLHTGPLVVQQKSDGSTPPQQNQYWLGDPDSAWKYQADSNPGTDDILLQIVDANPGSNNEPTAIKLATSQGGLAGSTPGAPLNLGVEITGGSVNAINVWVEADDETGVVGTDNDLTIRTDDMRKLAV